ncbi:MAG: tetratricopeptide repeat protein [Desulfobulbaceae bacterium]|nr:tetratricopeptide repeat protein [Desulfobulbaceae bacterium]HIJ90374.1 tetratricopeptide repeat protein [Deltaproteobacteria bacterium]
MSCFRRVACSPATQLAIAGIFAICVALMPCAEAKAAAAAAEIVMLIGKGDSRESSGADWKPAAVKQTIQGGWFVRTQANSQMAILMTNRTQIRLNQNSQLQIKPAVESAQGAEAVRLNSGRAWSQARPKTAPEDPAKFSKLKMETPSATMSIRGTDWEVEVSPDGRTQLVVLSGLVFMENEQGSVEVGNGEAAVAEQGKAPVKLILLNPANRVQWVSSWKPQPSRWVGKDDRRYTTVVHTIETGDYAAALQTLKPMAGQDAVAAVLAADLLIFQGENDAAVALLQAHVADGKADPQAAALLARAWARTDRFPEAEKLLDATIANNPDQVELLLARGELAILQGNAEQARQAYNEVLRIEANRAEAWYGLGLIESERENVREAKEFLNSALADNPKLSKASAELASVETFAGEIDTAEKLLDELLAREPDNYVALTARGINRLKAKRTNEALDDFLRVGLIEPRYARAWLFSGIAFYQLGESDRALQAFKRAAALDVHDPLPHLLQSVVEADALDYGASVKSAGEAQERMPYLKSLNQVANNQKGNANLGSSLAGFGMEEWATYYADEAYSPYWAGSHLFRADRYTGKFNKNSELLQGFLSDPTVFGASNRNSSLVNVPGHYGRIDAMLERTNWQQAALIGTVNGQTVTPNPFAYFVSGDLSTGDARDDGSSAHGGNLTLGLGMKPRYDLGLFGFATDTDITTDLETATLPDDSFKQREKRGDIGINYKRAPENQFWFKVGDGRQRNSVSGSYVSQSVADSFNNALATTIFTPAGILDGFESEITQDDIQFRHAFTSGLAQWAWGAEKSHQTRTGHLVTTFAPARLNIDELYSVKATDAYVSGRYQLPGKFSAQLDLFSQHVRTERNDLQTLDLLAPPAEFVLVSDAQERNYHEVNPRLGLKWQLGAMQSVRLVGQKWRRSASAGTLSEVGTLGIQVNDKLPTAGGLYERVRLQYDAEVEKTAFFQAYLDHEHIENGLGGQRTAITGFEVTQLESLRNRPEVFSPKSDLENTPVFIEGTVSTVGLSANFLVSKHQTLSASYLLRDSRQTGVDSDLLIPYVPHDYVQLGSQWSLPDRWLLGVSAVYRSMRYRDDANLDPIEAGWSFGLTAYWETTDKKSSIQAIVDNLLLDSNTADTQTDPHIALRYSYRF